MVPCPKFWYPVGDNVTDVHQDGSIGIFHF